MSSLEEWKLMCEAHGLPEFAKIASETKDDIERVWGTISLTGIPYTFKDYKDDDGKRHVSHVDSDGVKTMVAERRRDLERLENKWNGYHELSEKEFSDLINLGKGICENGIMINDKDAEIDPKKDFLARWEVLAVEVRQARNDSSMRHLDADTDRWELLKAYYLKLYDVQYRRGGAMDTQV